MLIDTAVLGTIEVGEQDLFHLPNGLPGFEQVHQYALIGKEEDGVTLRWFQAVDGGVPCFAVFNPFEVVDGYHPKVEADDLRALRCNHSNELDYLVIAVVPKDITKTTVNLKSPIALNRRENLARQVILSNKDYPIRFSLVEQPVQAQIS